MRRQGIGGQGPRAPLLVDDALQRGRDEERGEDAQEGARGDPELVEERLHQLVPGRPQLGRPVRPQHRQGLQEHRLLQDNDLAPPGPSGLHGPEEARMRYPLETAKSLFLYSNGYTNYSISDGGRMIGEVIVEPHALKHDLSAEEIRHA